MINEAKSSCRLDGETRCIEPMRVQLSRKKGWRKPENCVVVSRPSKWGNPYTSIPCAEPESSVSRESAVRLFRAALFDGRLNFTPASIRRELAGKNLACWCKLPNPGQPDHCHAAVLLEIANS